MRSPIGYIVMVFCLWRLLSFIPLLIAFSLVFTKILDWLGLNGLNVLYSKGIVDFFGRLFLNVLICIFLVAIFYNLDISNITKTMISEPAWTSSLSFRLMMFIFALIPILLIIGWITCIFQLFVKIINILIRD